MIDSGTGVHLLTLFSQCEGQVSQPVTYGQGGTCRQPCHHAGPSAGVWVISALPPAFLATSTLINSLLAGKQKGETEKVKELTQIISF